MLESTRQSAEGLLNFLELLSQQERIFSAGNNPYVRSHPLTTARIKHVREHVAKSKYSNLGPNIQLERMHDRMRGKLKGFIKTIGLYNSKAKNVINLSKILIKNYQSKIPSDFKDLTSLPGVGNKTASVYQNEILDIPRIAVDTHVYRVSNRLGLAKTKTADETQETLEQITPKKWLKTAHHLLILHGRYTCKSQNPICGECVVLKFCNFISWQPDGGQCSGRRRCDRVFRC